MTVSRAHPYVRPSPQRAAAAVALLVGFFVTACAGRGPVVPDNPATRVPQTQGNWFCQMGPSGDGWDCVQDPRLADDPEPQRLPEPTPPPEPIGSPDPPPAPAAPPGPGDPPRLEDVPAGAEQDEPPQERVQPDEDAAPAAAAPYPRAPDGTADEPDYVSLAYRPPRPTALTELRGDLYAVQLIAMSSRNALESFVEREGISGMSAARVERDGELYFVLLLGIYETVALARRAIESLPTDIAGARPWIRPLESLQAAMRRADELTGSPRF